MSVAAELGLADGVRSAVLVEAAACWPDWSGRDPGLRGPCGLPDLAGWLATADPADAERVLHGLVWLGSPRGGDEVLAARVVTWTLLPGACRMAGRLRWLSPQVDAMVAAELWVEVRCFRWERLGKVAANVLANTRSRVVTRCGVSSRRFVSDPTWARSVTVDPHSQLWDGIDAANPEAMIDSAAELQDLLVEAGDVGVLTTQDRRLLALLVAQARVVGCGSRRGMNGLLADGVVRAVSGETGLAPSTVRRRVRAAVDAVAAAQRSGLIVAA